MAMETDHERALRLAVEAGHILLENGAEISRVEETMQRISAHFCVEKQSFFVLSNGIIVAAAVSKRFLRAIKDGVSSSVAEKAFVKSE